MKTVTAGDVTLQVHDEGAGTTMLFVHGFPLSHAMWLGQLPTLKSLFRVVAPDLRGFGGSPLPEGSADDPKTTMRQLADDCAALLDDLQIREPIVFCGLSMGGYVAWQFAKHYPDRLKGLILCDTKAAADSPEARETRLKMAEHVKKHGTGAVAEAMLPKLFGQATHKDKPEIVAEIRKTIEQTCPRGLAAAQRGMAERDDVRDFLPQIQVPTLVIVGREDVISPVDEMRAIADAIPGAKFHVVEQTGHMAPLEQPGDVNTLIADFVGGLQ